VETGIGYRHRLSKLTRPASCGNEMSCASDSISFPRETLACARDKFLRMSLQQTSLPLLSKIYNFEWLEIVWKTTNLGIWFHLLCTSSVRGCFNVHMHISA